MPTWVMRGGFPDKFSKYENRKNRLPDWAFRRQTQGNIVCREAVGNFESFTNFITVEI